MTQLFILAIACLGSVNLAWTPSPDPRMVTNPPSGYVVVYGPTSRTYSGSINVGNVTNATLKDLSEGSTNYISAFAYASPSLQSALANEVVYVVPRTVRAPAVTGLHLQQSP